MSTVTQFYNDGNNAHFGFDTSKIFIFDNKFNDDSFENTTGALQSLVAGTLVGRVTATGNLEVLKSAAVDGSQLPVGMLTKDYQDIAIGATIDVSVCVFGEVAEEKVVLDGADTLDTMITGRPIKDRINGDTAGIVLRPTTQLTDYDNQ